MIVARGSLYTRLVVRIGGVLVVSAVLLLVSIWVTTQFAANETYDRMLVGNALQIAENTIVQEGSVSVDVPLAAFTLTPGDQTFYAVQDHKGRTIAGDPNFRPRIEWSRLEEGPLLYDGEYQDLPVRIAVVGRRMTIAGEHPWAVIAIAQTTAGRRSFAKSLDLKATVIILVMGLLTVAAALFTLYQALSPLVKIEKAIASRDPNDLSPFAQAVPVEIFSLVNAINGFMRRLSEHRFALEHMIGDAAHQLRTPIASMVSQTEMLSIQTDEGARRAHVERLRELSLNLAKLVNQLINYAMVQHRSMNPEFSSIDLSELVRHEVAEILSGSATRDLDIEMRVPDGPCKVRGDPTTLAESIKNVTHNALQYGAPRLFHVYIREQGGNWVVQFEDDGAGIDFAHQDRLRQPFAVRVGGRIGASLGLSIVDRVMRAHGGHLQFARTADAHFVVELVLPKLL